MNDKPWKVARFKTTEDRDAFIEAVNSIRNFASPEIGPDKIEVELLDTSDRDGVRFRITDMIEDGVLDMIKANNGQVISGLPM